MSNIVDRVKIFLSKKGIRRAVIVLAALLLFLYYPLDKPLVRSSYSKVITDRDGNIMRVFLTEDEQYCMAPEFNDSIPEKLKVAVVHFEDKYFYYHPGVNPVSIVKAFYQNIKQQRIVSGASTITMQLARIRKGRKRSASNKVIEIFEAFRIEAQYSKQEVLKLYLDHAPYGGNIIGYQAASWRYFGKPPQKLSWAEACLLAVLPNAPGTVSPIKNNQILIEKRNKLLESLYASEVIDKSTYANSVDEPMPTSIVPFDLRAPHLTRKIAANVKDEYVIRTSIEASIQDNVNYLVQRYGRNLNNFGINNAAVLVIHNKTHKVRAYVGSQDFYGTAGKVDGVMASRSSGSLLKPFLYALCIQDGIIIPESQMQDIPTYYGSFSPSNASEKFDGVVTAHDALVRSLNVPAVRLLYTYGHYKFYNFLQSAGISTLFRSADDYGLPLIIGGAEVTLFDISSSYCCLANLGQYHPISYFEDSPDIASTPIIDSVSTLLTLNMLKDLRRPGSEFYWNKFNGQQPIAWKTGTSYGHKDAWAIGVNPEWTVAVWVGNFNAESNKNLSGAKSAGPLMLDVFNALPKKDSLKWWNLEDYSITTMEVCDVSGYASTPRCNATTIKRVSTKDNLKPCPFHIKIELDSLEEYSVCSGCWESGHHSKNIVSYPPLVTSYLRRNGAVVERIPFHKPACKLFKARDLIVVECPKPNSKLFVTRDFDGEYQPVIFSAVHQMKGQKIYWYLDNKYLGETDNKHKMAIAPVPGKHILSLTDAFGNTQSVEFTSTQK